MYDIATTLYFILLDEAAIFREITECIYIYVYIYIYININTGSDL